MTKKILAIVPVIVLVLTACAPDAPETSGMVIVNARIIDGSGGTHQTNLLQKCLDNCVAGGASAWNPPVMPSTITRNSGFVPLLQFTIQKGLKTRA